VTSNATDRTAPSENGKPRRSKHDIDSGRERPEALTVKTDFIPPCLRKLARWVCWRYEWEDGRWAKIPLNPRTGRRAKINDPSTWGTFGEAVRHYRRTRGEDVDGIGIVFTAKDDLLGVDLDDARDAESGKLTTRGREILKGLNSYAEVSPSGTGIKCFVLGAWPEDAENVAHPGGMSKLEVYDRKRFFAVTGRRLGKLPEDVQARPEAVRRLYDRWFERRSAPPGGAGRPAPPDPEGDEQLIESACRGADGKFRRLWEGDTGDYGDDDSRADQALCSYLAWLTRDRDRTERLFGRSELGKRSKWWDRADYRARTLDKAMEGVPTPRRVVPRPGAGGYVCRLRTGAQMLAEAGKPEWFAEHALLKGQMAIVGGPLKSLKTGIGMDLAVSLAAGRSFLGHFDVPRVVKVAFLCGEGGGGVLSRLEQRICEAKKVTFDRLDTLMLDDRLPMLANDAHVREMVGALEDWGAEVGVIDPTYLCLLTGSTLNPASMFDVGGVLTNLAGRCMDAGITPVLMHHANQGLRPGERATLADLAYGGVSMYAGQWLLVNRRRPFDPESGRHELWLSLGAREGQSREYSLDITEGQLDADFTGKVWYPAVFRVGDQRDRDRQARKETARANREEKKSEGDAEADVALLAALDKLDRDRVGFGYERLRVQAGLSRDRMRAAADRLIAAKVISPIRVDVTIGNGGIRAVDGLRRGESD
jgi:hypothetical protein